MNEIIIDGKADRMDRKQRFLMWTSLGATAMDLQNGTRNAERFSEAARKIRSDAIPPQVRNASQVFLHHLQGHGHRFKWMGQVDDLEHVVVE